MAKRKVTVQIELDDKFTEGAEKIQGSLKDMDSGLKRLKVAAGVAAVGMAAMTAALYATQRALSKALGEAGDYELQLAKLNAILKSTGGAAGLTTQEMQALATEMQKVTMYSDSTVLRGEAVMATFTRIGRETFPVAVKAAADMAAVMGTDLQSAVVMLGKALNDPLIGLTALRRVGVSFTQEQTDLIKKLAEEGDLLQAQRLILQEVQREFGGAAQAMGQTYAGQVERLKNALSDVFKNTGLLIAQQPEFREGMESLVRTMADFAAQIKESGAIKELGRDIGTLLKTIASNLDTFTRFVDEWAKLADYAAKFGTWVIQSSAAVGPTAENTQFFAPGATATGATAETEGPAFLQFFKGLQQEGTLETVVLHTAQIGDEAEKAKDNWQDLASAMEKTLRIPEKLAGRLQREMEDFTKYIQELNAVQVNMEQISEMARMELEAEHAAHLQAVQDTIEVIDTATGLTKELTDALTKMMDGTAVEWEDMLTRMLKALEEWIIEVLARMAVIEAVNLALGGGLGIGEVFSMAAGVPMSAPRPVITPGQETALRIEVHNATPDTYVRVFQELPAGAKIRIREALQ